MPKLTCKNVWFYAQGDETSFFNWIKTIKCIKKYEGIGDTMFLYIKSSKPSDTCLRELLALFFRYKIDMTQLAQFLSEKNRSWFFNNQKAYWHKRVFKNKIL